MILDSLRTGKATSARNRSRLPNYVRLSDGIASLRRINPSQNSFDGLFRIQREIGCLLGNFLRQSHSAQRTADFLKTRPVILPEFSFPEIHGTHRQVPIVFVKKFAFARL